MEEILHRPRRSVLYVPGSNEKAQGKISSLEVDALIYDLEDAVAPAAKDQARSIIIDLVNSNQHNQPSTSKLDILPCAFSLDPGT
jgi:citrate lyase subunit beta/citryl-CoA lyase